MSDNGRLWLIALSAALVGALLGAGAVWATQQSTAASLNARLIQADAATQAALQESAEVAAELEALKATAVLPEPTNPPTTTVPVPEKKKPQTTTKQFTFVADIDESGAAPVIVADYAQMLTGAEAAAAASAAGDESPPPNDYYIVNANKALRKLKVKPGISVNVATNDDGTSDPNGHTVTFADWAANFAAPTAENEGVRTAPYWIWVRDGTVIKIKQQYLP